MRHRTERLLRPDLTESRREDDSGRFRCTAPSDPDTQRRPIDRDLKMACMKGDFERAEKSVNEGADVNGRDTNSLTKLMWAARGGEKGGRYKEIVELLIERGADVLARSICGETARDIAIEAGRYDIAEVLSAAEARAGRELPAASC
ncbi:MAG: ankyrin repeat domain-containing protein [Candidatus Micrarchaeota archaeon]